MKALPKLATLLALASVATVLVLPRESRGDIAPQFKCSTYVPTMSKHVWGTDGRVYCCANAEPTVLPPANMDKCVPAPWDVGSRSPVACASSVTGLVEDTVSGDVMGEDEDPLEFFLTPNSECRVCSSTSESALLAAAKAKAANFCAKEANFSGGPTRLTSFEPAGRGRGVCDKWKFRCSCPPR